MRCPAKIKAYGGAILMLAFFVLFAVTPAFASGKHNDDPEQSQKQSQKQGQQQGQEQGQSQDVTVNIGGGEEGSLSTMSTGATTLSGGDTSLDLGDSRVENNSSNVVLVPNNNTESCLRVWGLGWGNASGSGGIGVPVRSKKCDYEAAADDAFAAGERELGWFWKCENPNLYRSFREDRSESKESAKVDSLDKMLGGVTSMKTITTLTEQLESSEEERRIARQKHSESVERLTSACNESNDRVLAACVNSK